jgi:hypothetical protein
MANSAAKVLRINKIKSVTKSFMLKNSQSEEFLNQFWQPIIYLVKVVVKNAKNKFPNDLIGSIFSKI